MDAAPPNTSHVDLWQVCLEAPAGGGDDHALLSAEECERAGRFRVEGGARRYVAARAALRRILGDVTGRAPGAIEIDVEPQGRPVLRPEAGRELPWFNLSHAEDLALVAVCWTHPVGVDVERVRAVSDAVRLAARFFSPREAAAVAAAPPAERDAAFLRLFTVKEAVLKAEGTGIVLPLGRLEACDDLARVTSTTVRAADGASWAVALPEVAHGHVAAVATRTSVLVVRGNSALS